MKVVPEWHEDVIKGVKNMVEFLGEKRKVVLYQGQLNLRDGMVSTEWKEIERLLERNERCG